MFAAALINNSLKKMGTYEVETKPSVKFDKNNIINLFKNPIFKSFIIPNFTRGITAGIIGIVAIIGFHDNILDKVSAAYLVTAATVANIAGSILYTVLSKLIKSNILCLLGSIMTLALLFLSSNSIIIYIAGYFIAYLGIMIISLAIPYRVYEIIPFEIAGIYNSWRMILMTAGITFSTVATGFAIKFVPSYVIFIIAIVCQLYCGIIYFLYNKKHL
ncbi:MAG: hypothetical protein FWF15_10795 [Oscillospiraceae bacterium]|nr:hypothetical protein [Oscillospiraceae bacterium]